MHHPADSTTELCHCGEHDNGGGMSIPMYHSSGGAFLYRNGHNYRNGHYAMALGALNVWLG